MGYLFYTMVNPIMFFLFHSHLEGPHFHKFFDSGKCSNSRCCSSLDQSIKVDLQPRRFAAADLLHLRRTQGTQRQILPGR